MGLMNEIEIKFSRKYENYYKKINKDFVKNKGKGIDWSDLCYIPMAGTIAEITEGALNPALNLNIINDASLMAALCGWKANNKNIIKIDEIQEKRLLNQKYEEILIDSKSIYNKIGYGTFLELKIDMLEALGIYMEGVLLHIEHDVNENRLELRANVLDKRKKIIPLVLHLNNGSTIAECIDDTIKFTSNMINKTMKSNTIIDFKDLILAKELNEEDRMYYLNYIVFTLVLSFLK